MLCGVTLSCNGQHLSKRIKKKSSIVLDYLSHVKGCQEIISGGQKWFIELKNSIHKSFNKI